MPEKTARLVTDEDAAWARRILEAIEALPALSAGDEQLYGFVLKLLDTREALIAELQAYLREESLNNRARSIRARNHARVFLFQLRGNA